MALDIFIIGLDQIGASIGMALSQSEMDVRCTGYDPDGEITRQAHQLGVFDQVTSRPVAASEIADVVVIATSSLDVRELLEMLGEELKAGAIVLDTSPFKAHHTTWASELLPDERHYIGAMPILGPEALLTERPDLTTPRADLFQGGLLAMVVPPKTSEEAVNLALQFAAAIGATPFFLDSLEHDAVIATVHGLPYIMAVALMKMGTRAHNWREIQRIAGRPFLKATGIDPAQLGKPQAYTLHLNREVIINKLDEFIDELRGLQELISKDDHSALENYVTEAVKDRDSWLAIRQSGDWAGQDLKPSVPIERPSFLSRALGFRPKRPKDHKKGFSFRRNSIKGKFQERETPFRALRHRGTWTLEPLGFIIPRCPGTIAPKCPFDLAFGSPRRSAYNPPMPEYFCYIIECADDTLYTGITNDPGRRLREHELGRGARYTRSRRPLHLAYVEEQPDLKTAMRRERAIKALSRERKLALIASQPMGEPEKSVKRGK